MNHELVLSLLDPQGATNEDQNPSESECIFLAPAKKPPFHCRNLNGPNNLASGDNSNIVA